MITVMSTIKAGNDMNIYQVFNVYSTTWS